MISTINYYNWGTYPMDEVIDEQKIILALVKNNAKKEILFWAEDVDKLVNKYFEVGINEHKSIKSGYIEAEYEDNSYRIIKVPQVGAVGYYLSNITVKKKTRLFNKKDDTFICTADLMFIHAVGIDKVGESKIVLIKENSTYKIRNYSQDILDEPIAIEREDL